MRGLVCGNIMYKSPLFLCFFYSISSSCSITLPTPAAIAKHVEIFCQPSRQRIECAYQKHQTELKRLNQYYYLSIGALGLSAAGLTWALWLYATGDAKSNPVPRRDTRDTHAFFAKHVREIEMNKSMLGRCKLAAQTGIFQGLQWGCALVISPLVLKVVANAWRLLTGTKKHIFSTIFTRYNMAYTHLINVRRFFQESAFSLAYQIQGLEQEKMLPVYTKFKSSLFAPLQAAHAHVVLSLEDFLALLRLGIETRHCASEVSVADGSATLETIYACLVEYTQDFNTLYQSDITDASLFINGVVECAKQIDALMAWSIQTIIPMLGGEFNDLPIISD